MHLHSEELIQELATKAQSFRIQVLQMVYRGTDRAHRRGILGSRDHHLTLLPPAAH